MSILKQAKITCSILESFKAKFGNLVNPQLTDLQICYYRGGYFLFAAFSERGNVPGDSDALHTIECLHYFSGIKPDTDFPYVVDIIVNKLDVEGVALSGLGDCSYLLRPEITKYIQLHGTSEGLDLTGMNETNTKPQEHS